MTNIQPHTHARQPQPLQGGLREEVLGVVCLNGGRFIGAIIDSFEASDARSAIRLFNALDAWSSYALSKLRRRSAVRFQVCISMRYLFFWKALYGTRNSISLCFFLFLLFDSVVYGDSRV